MIRLALIAGAGIAAWGIAGGGPAGRLLGALARELARLVA